MFISKRKWEDMCERVDDLENIHSIRFEKKFCNYFGINILEKVGYKHSSNTIKVSTNEISDITLEELARLVIDGTPITRKVIEENIKEYGGKE